MVFRLNDKARKLTRQDLADPHRGRSLRDRLAEVRASDLRDNATFVDYGGGYGSLVPLDPSKKFGAKATEFITNAKVKLRGLSKSAKISGNAKPIKAHKKDHPRHDR